MDRKSDNTIQTSKKRSRNRMRKSKFEIGNLDYRQTPTANERFGTMAGVPLLIAL
jgi:hypothetical protein